ncbi:MFS transporter [Paraburkholderia rhynchosiae]|uniref:4-hydroxybenzoate transporter PcaK n=1 Tax=Paraburkholderia rhynchosiae TaxID=487049 RepID=A0A2N7W7Z3_9BURK|nr:MFS transporter [Paraburkholderia rhynchosiae]PMS25511.1 MFS transporter [Paraburkholderia rhynchosiae]CAB3733618.1 4-hydroxybenzoate transporter PcaK [Paraburkholderia rhynchosiae]
MPSIDGRPVGDIRNGIAVPISTGRVGRFQAIVVLICVLVNAVDGYDILVMSFAAPAVAKAWSLSGSQLGMAFSAGLFGILIGTVVLSPWSDRFGRRPLVIGSLMLVTVGMVFSGLAPTLKIFLMTRALTGIGVGGLLSSTAVLVAEYASDRHRSSAISLLGVGYSVGAMAGGLVARWLLETFGWRSSFLAGTCLSAFMLVLATALLPESVDFLLFRRPKNALRQLNRILRRMKCHEISQLPPRVATVMKSTSSVGRLLDRNYRTRTLLIWTAFFLHLMGLYFLLSWTPKLLAASTSTQSVAVHAGVALNVGGIVGSLAFSVFAPFFNLRKLTVFLFGITAIATVLFGMGMTNPALVLPLAAAVGLLSFGALAGIYSLAPTAYETQTRGTGVGWALGMGRVGAMISPFAAGVLLDTGSGSLALYIVFAIPFALAAVAVSMLGRSEVQPAMTQEISPG